MAIYAEGRGAAAEAEPFGALTEGAAGIAAIVLAIIALAGISVGALASITTIVIGVALIVQAFNAAAEMSRAFEPSATAAGGVAGRGSELGGEIMIHLAAGVTGIVLGILSLVGINTFYLVPAALIVFGSSLILGGVTAAQAGQPVMATASSGTQTQIRYQGAAGISGLQILVGFAAAILGILSLIFQGSWVLVLVGFIAVGTALLIVSASFSGAVVRLFTRAA
ncbi:MAG: hypothetical protein JO320_04785 [Alphaproteobacteria bacterium]|nr:hypothetical protein [Alphaproteobacteria bacterium]